MLLLLLSVHQGLTHPRASTMIIKSFFAAGAALGVLSAPVADAFHPSGGLPRGARSIRGGGVGGEQRGLSAAAGFDIGEWLRQAFNPQTKGATKKKAE